MKIKSIISMMIAIMIVFSCIYFDKNNLAIQASAIDVSNLFPVDSTYSFLKELEGYNSECYWDNSQWTIGYGNKCPYTHTRNGTRGEKGGHTISESTARQLFNEKLSGYVSILKSNCKGISMNQNQFDVLLSATYNHGNVLRNGCSHCGYTKQPLVQYLLGNLSESEARTQYYVWCINKGTADENGLRNRRKKEANKFFSGVTPSIYTVTIHYNANGGTVASDSNYYIGSNNDLYRKSDDKLMEPTWEEGYKDENGLINASTLKLTKSGYYFLEPVQYLFAHVFSANFADCCVEKAHHTTVCFRFFALLSSKLCSKIRTRRDTEQALTLLPAGANSQSVFCSPKTAAALNGNHNSSDIKTAIFRYIIKQKGYVLRKCWKAYPYLFLFQKLYSILVCNVHYPFTLFLRILYRSVCTAVFILYTAHYKV